LSGPERYGHILLVEDFPGLGSVAAKALRREGYEVVVTESGESALEALARESQPDIVITDVQLPGMSGLELVERIRRTIPEMRVVVVSGSLDHGPAITRLGSRTVFLAKPYQIHELVGKVQELFVRFPRRSSGGH
jgi:DNA-binding response OmpR family regulator